MNVNSPDASLMNESKSFDIERNLLRHDHDISLSYKHHMKKMPEAYLYSCGRVHTLSTSTVIKRILLKL